jgi:thiol-disulfide isomerase/thioredoxin
MKKLLPLLLLSAGLAACGPQADQAAGGKPAGAPRKDAPAPPLVLETFVSGDLKAVKGWGDLKGKAVVLEFWATFCDPCVDNIPHMNELAENFKDKPVVFISLTRDSRGEIEEFIKTHPMQGNVAVEAVGAFKNFKVRGIPHLVLVDKEGVIRGFSYPSMVTPETVNALLVGSKTIPGIFMEKPEQGGKAG